MAAEEHLATALSEMYVGSWCGRRWFVPTVFYQNQAHDKQAWHMPEKVHIPIIHHSVASVGVLHVFLMRMVLSIRM